MSRSARWRLTTAAATLAVLGVAAIVVAAGSGDPVAEPGPPVSSPLTIGAAVGQPIPAGFLGFSIEFQAIRSYTGHNPQQINPVLVSLLRNLSPGAAPVIRIGGDSTDASWVPAPGVKPPPQVTYRLTPGWFATTAALVHQLGARLIVGINLGANQPALAAAEAREDVRAFGSSIAAFEIGNEPNVYDVIAAYHTRTGGSVTTRPRGYAFPEYLREFRAISATLPPAELAGPALAAGPTPTQGSWIQTLAGFLASERRVRILTIHRYPLRNCYVGTASPQYPTVAHLLSSYSTVNLAAGVRRYIAIAHASRRSLRIDELNSVACRGKSGVSNTFASGLWVLDALFALARQGVDGVNMHTLPNSAYQLFKFSHAGGRWSASIAPVYYGLDMFARAAAPGSRLLKIYGGHRGAGLSVWATRSPGGQVQAVIINESPTMRETVGLDPPAGMDGPATVLRMAGPSPWARSGVTIGGSSFAPYTGLLGPAQTQSVGPRGRTISLVVPAASAALVSFSSG